MTVENDATREFNMHWQNDYDLYKEVVSLAREMLRRVPGMTQQTIGRNVKDRVFAWQQGGGWGYDDGRKHVRALEYLRVAHADVQEDLVGEEVLDALGLEGYDPVTGNVI